MSLKSKDLFDGIVRRFVLHIAVAWGILAFAIVASYTPLSAQSETPQPTNTPLPENVVRTVQTLNSTVAEDLADGELLRLKRGTIQQISYAPDGQTIAVATNIGVWLYETSGSNARYLADLSPVWSVSWSPDSRLLASGSIDGAVRIWRVADGAKLQELSGHSAQVRAVAWSPDGDQVASASDDGTIIVWSQGVEDFEQTILTGHEVPVTYLAWSPDGSQIYSASSDGSVRVWAISESSGLAVTASASTIADDGASAPTEENSAAAEAETTPLPPDNLPGTPAITASVQVNRLRVREGPGTDFADFARVSEGETVELTGQVEECAWVRILTADGTVGWVAGQPQFLTIDGSCDDIREVDPATEPLLPTPAPTATPTPAPTPTPPLQDAPADQGCYLFQNALSADLTLTFEPAGGGESESFEISADSELEYCLAPGQYTYTISAPPPWSDISGQLPVQAGDRFLFPIRGE